MDIRYGVAETERKRPAERAAKFLSREYLGAPGFACRADSVEIGRDGTLRFDDRIGSEKIEGLLGDPGRKEVLPQTIGTVINDSAGE